MAIVSMSKLQLELLRSRGGGAIDEMSDEQLIQAMAHHLGLHFGIQGPEVLELLEAASPARAEAGAS